jgi:hypothetical protein
MGISGIYCKTFAEASIACITKVSMDADLPHFWFDVVACGDGVVTLKDQGEEVRLPIKRNKNSEYVELQMIGEWERLFKGGKPSVYRFLPFRGKRY